ncbi:MAG TPA: hypothetical protein VII32_04795, partial [Thermoanaerobaculia bacterium]
MAISDEELVRQLEAVPQVEPPEMKDVILARLRTPHPPFGHLLPASGAKDLRAETPRPAKRGEGGAQRRVRGVLIGLAWAAAIIIVVTVV